MYKNRYEDLSGDLTLIHSEQYSNEGKLVQTDEIYFDSDYKEYVISRNMIFRVYEDGKVGANNLEGGTSFLINIIGNAIYGYGYNFSVINGNSKDLRAENIFAYPKSQGRGRWIKYKLEEIKHNVPSIEERLKMPTKPKWRMLTHAVEYEDGHLLVCEPKKIKYDIDEIAATAIKLFMAEVLNIAITNPLNKTLERAAKNTLNIQMDIY